MLFNHGTSSSTGVAILIKRSFSNQTSHNQRLWFERHFPSYQGYNDRIFTHFNKQHGTASRLDFFLIDDDLVNFPICTSDISHGYISDHSYVSLNIQGSSIVQGEGYGSSITHIF